MRLVDGVVGSAVLVEADLVEAVFEEGLGLRPFAVLVLKGLANGARLISLLVFVTGFARGCFFDPVADTAREDALPKIAKKSSAVVRRPGSIIIYRTPTGLAFSG